MRTRTTDYDHVVELWGRCVESVLYTVPNRNFGFSTILYFDFGFSVVFIKPYVFPYVPVEAGGKTRSPISAKTQFNN